MLTPNQTLRLPELANNSKYKTKCTRSNDSYSLTAHTLLHLDPTFLKRAIIKRKRAQNSKKSYRPEHTQDPSSSNPTTAIEKALVRVED